MPRTYKSGQREWFSSRANLEQELNNAFVLEGFTELSQKLDRLLTSSPDMEEQIQRIVGKVLNMVRDNVSGAYKQKLNSDPRMAYKAVRRMVYRRILGGNINILRNKRAGSPNKYTPTRTLKPGQRGGNRKERSERTMRMESYGGRDRGFILRFLEGGTDTRQVKGFKKNEHRGKVKRGSQGGDLSKYGNIGKVNTGNRGSLKAYHIFAAIVPPYMDNAIQYLEKEIDTLIQQEFAR
jgi:hypothetical protein